jgi:hypothetical protein
VVCLGVQLGGYERVLAPGLRSADVAARGRALKRWVLFALVWQGLVILGCFVYAFLVTRRGLVWIAPPVAALLGTALPYQLVAVRLARAGRG